MRKTIHSAEPALLSLHIINTWNKLQIKQYPRRELFGMEKTVKGEIDKMFSSVRFCVDCHQHNDFTVN